MYYRRTLQILFNNLAASENSVFFCSISQCFCGQNDEIVRFLRRNVDLLEEVFYKQLRQDPEVSRNRREISHCNLLCAKFCERA
jgi:hypothetical protein